MCQYLRPWRMGQKFELHTLKFCQCPAPTRRPVTQSAGGAAVNICVRGVWVKNSSYMPSSSASVRRRLVGPLLSQPAGLEIQAGGAPSLSQEIICIMFLGYVPPV